MVAGVQGRTAINTAVDHGRLNVVEFLLDRGADATIPEWKGVTPLMKAASDENISILRRLLREEAVRMNIDAQDRYGRTALYGACDFNQPAAVRLLLQSGADPMVGDEDGDRAMGVGSGPESRKLLKVGGCVIRQTS